MARRPESRSTVAAQARQAGPLPAYWSCGLAELDSALRSGPEGLSAAAAAARLRRCGPNAVESGRRLSALRQFLRQFENPLVLILVFGAAVSATLQGWTDAAIILTIVLGSALLGFFQEFRAAAAIERLKRRLALTCRVMRDGIVRSVPASAIVPGDVVLLSAGSLIPADGRVLEARDLLVDEAGLTGESFPVEKRPGRVPPQAPLSTRSNSVFLGSSVRSGSARILVVETGQRTAFGAIAGRMRANPPKTDFQRGMLHFGYLLLRVMAVIILFVLMANLLLGRPMAESLLFAVALAVGLSPELLPAIVSVTLAAGARAMARKGIIVRRLEAIENLGSIDILCTDKTGTLTEGVATLADATDVDGRSSPRVRALGFLNAAFETGIDNPLDAAIMTAAASAGLTTGGHRKIAEIPYDFHRRRLTIVVTSDRAAARHLIITKGAFASMLPLCASLGSGNGVVPLSDDRRARLEDFYRSKGAEGFRVLALATREAAPKENYGPDDEREMCFVGFLLFLDPPKPGVQRTMQALADLGIRVKIISGDNRHVTAHLARSIGMDPAAMLTGEELARLDDAALWHLAPRTALFVEVDPQQKERIIRVLQRAGHAVGYLGDGINDAPALHVADVGISVDRAVDVARESADMILLTQDLDVLRRGVEEGRRTFVNTLKYIHITTSANFGNMVSMALAAPFLPFLPLAAKQILLNNFLSDLPSVAIATDNVDTDLVARPQRWRIGEIWRFMIVFGLISSAFDMVTLAGLLAMLHADQAAFQTIWFVVSLLTELAAILVLRSHAPMTRSKPGRLLLCSTIAVAIMGLVIPFLGRPAAAFGFVPLVPSQIGLVLAVVAGYALATEATKLWFYRRWSPIGR